MKLLIISIAFLWLLPNAVCADEWQQEMDYLRENVQILKKRIETQFESGISSETSDLQLQSGKRGESIRELNIRLDDLNHQMDESAANFDRISRDIEIRIKMLEGKEIPASLSAPAPNIPTTFDAPVATEAAREVVWE